MNPETSHPRDLPGRYGRVVRDLERLLQSTQTLAVVAGGWAVWRHGYVGRVTQDVDIVVPKDKLEELRSVANICGFDFFQPPEGRWPKLVHRQTQIDVDLLPEMGVPGTPSHPAPIAIKHPAAYDAIQGRLEYISLGGLFELKLGASRAKDIADIIELIKVRHSRNHGDNTNVKSEELLEITEYLASAHTSYAKRFLELIQQAREEV